MDVRLLYNQLLDEIHADEVALDEKRELVRLLKKRIGAEVSPAALAVDVVEQTRRAQVVEYQAAVQGKPLAQTVEEAMPLMAGREFVVGDVADTIRGPMGVPLPDKPNTAISTVLKRLEASGVIARTFTGVGSAPNRYRLASEAKSIEQQAAGQQSGSIA